ncbi:MAG: peroxidase [Acidobacteria bacterium]|nr:peroxidase [Acidobacteriota bacterium]
MAWVKVIPVEEASPELREIYNEIRDPTGRLSPALQILSLNPKAMRALHALNRVITFGGSRLGRKREEVLSVVISKLNGCSY